MKKNIFLLILITLFFNSARAQEQFAKNAFFLEILGNGGLYSINYERAFNPKFLLKVGSASWSIIQDFGGEKSHTTIPVMINSLFGSGSHKIEGGL